MWISFGGGGRSFELVVTGKLNKEFAFDLGTAEKTIKVHRANLRRKLHRQSLAVLGAPGPRVG
jgi:FixJ family two-component response regulator